MSREVVHNVIMLSFYMGLFSGMFLLMFVDWIAGIIGRFIARKMAQREFLNNEMELEDEDVE